MSAPRKRSSSKDDFLAAEGLEAWQAEPLADVLAETFQTEVSERHTRNGKIDIYVCPSKKTPKDADLLEAFVAGALAMLDEVSRDGEEGEEEVEDDEEEDDIEEVEDEPARRRR